MCPVPRRKPYSITFSTAFLWLPVPASAHVGAWILGEEELINLNLSTHLEWWAVDFQFTSMTSQLFWVFNQAIPAWVATIMVMTQKHCKNMLFILSLMMLSSTIPFVGLIVKEPMAQCLRYLLFYFLEFGIYLCFVCRYRKRDSLVYLITAVLLVCPFIKVGSGHDFCMRASIPALFILMLLCIETLEKIRKEGKRYLLTGYCIVLILGAVTSFNEIHRSVRETYWRVASGESVRYPETPIEEGLFREGNFSGEVRGNIFYKYFANVYSIYQGIQR